MVTARLRTPAAISVSSQEAQAVRARSQTIAAGSESLTADDPVRTAGPSCVGVGATSAGAALTDLAGRLRRGFDSTVRYSRKAPDGEPQRQRGPKLRHTLPGSHGVPPVQHDEA